ncbi:hypothetical protein OPHB3_1809 [Oceanobacillus picturae]|uniref:Uncharacterized protein n=1 Tax=Oceanobacillus picturae TaxID=171693 RepID=A0A0U9H731_9BACI|nr:hypothetical protein [Oceanobacillus picturae]GAQ17872.1 hypothetical protein OPHB3_1809 [Oceanobacillus picturae]
MKRSNESRIFRGSLISLCLSLVLLPLMIYLREIGIYIQFGTPPPFIGHKLIEYILIVNVVISLCFIIKSRSLKSIMVLAGVFVLLARSIFYSFPNPLWETEVTTLVSPDNSFKYIVVETGVGHLYKLSESGLYMTFITTLRTDDGYQPFANDAYKIDWLSSEQFVIHYAFDVSSEEMDKEVTISIE